MTSPTPAAVLWDMDGTLVDTEPYWMAAEERLVASHGGTWTHEESLQLVGSGLEDAAKILQNAGVSLDVDEIVQTLTSDVMVQLQTQGAPFRPGAQELLRSLREAGVKTALVTMSMRRMADIVVSLIDFEAFDIVIGGDDVERPKPHPDPYLQACRALGVSPEDAVAIEDSPNGLRASLAAEVPSIGVPHIVSLQEVGADILWPTLEGRTAEHVAAFHAEHRAGAAL